MRISLKWKVTVLRFGLICATAGLCWCAALHQEDQREPRGRAVDGWGSWMEKVSAEWVVCGYS